MVARDWSSRTPTQVAEAMTFDRDAVDWAYEEGDTSMPARQAEGVAGLWNKLSSYGVALLADEVGTGKTLQALGVMALLWQRQPDARVLVMAPNRDICRHWEREYRKFVKTHYKKSDGKVRSRDGEPMHPPKLFGRLEDLAAAVEDVNQHFFVTTIHALSGLVRDEDSDGFDKLLGAARVAATIHDRIKKVLGDHGFDLIVVDEAHYFRNSDGNSQRAKAARNFFGASDDRLASHALLMTATPSHKSMEDITAILGYFTDTDNAGPDELLKKYALRRLRRMQGLHASHDKYSYRNEQAVASEFSDPAAEMFFALYQKLLAKKKSTEGRRFLYGYLEGFESFDAEEREEVQNTEEDSAKRDFQGAPDTDILKQLARLHDSLGGLPPHPKYDALVSGCMPVDVFDTGIDVHEHKHLVFVRRIPSVREIAKRINSAYDEQMGCRIVRALAPDRAEEMLRRFRASRWSREAFNRLFPRSTQSDDVIDVEDSFDSTLVEHPDNGAEVQSRVADLFVVKKTGARSTDCSNFSLRLRKPESLFSMLLEPASDYRDGAYTYYYRKRSGDRLRDEYALAALEAREAGKIRGSAVISDDKLFFDAPLQTLWGLMYRLLAPPHLEQMAALVSDRSRAESFGHYLKNGFLFASPVIVELYCWYVEFERLGQHGFVQQRYKAFLDFVDSRLRSSLALAYFRSAIETFETMRENWEDQDKNRWHVLAGLSSPAFYASGAVHDRQRLILGFNSPFYPNVLAATSVLQEGVNLHLQCRKVHHYGIAWTPGDNEQRVGRVDRLFGKLNSLLKRDGSAELAIHYPYLARSFDEEQLASFLREKHLIEKRMDACRQYRSSGEVDLRSSTENWQSYLRKPTSGASGGEVHDPFPYHPIGIESSP